MTSAGNPDVRFDGGTPIRLVGLIERYQDSNMGDVPRQWERFASELQTFEPSVSGPHFGVHYSLSATPVSFDYLTGVAAPPQAITPTGFVERHLEPHHSAVFSYNGKASDLGILFHHIFDKWMPECGHRPRGNPLFFEVYHESFDAVAGEGAIEVWVPLEPKEA